MLRDLQRDRRVKAATVHRVRATPRSALQAAVRKGLIGYNPARDIDLPRTERPKVRPLEPAELGKLLDHVNADPLGALYAVIAATGLRRGEALGLRWDDADLENGVIVVRRAVVQLAGRHPCPYCEPGHAGVVFTTPKSASSEGRIVDLDDVTLGSLLEWRLRQDAERSAWADAYADHGLIFCREDGNPLDPKMVTAYFGQLCDDAGIRRVRVHDLRHGAASLRLAAGVDIAIVSKVLGHSQISLTADTYSQLLEGVGKDAAQRAMNLVPRTPRTAAVQACDQPVIS
jgi:integrase